MSRPAVLLPVMESPHVTNVHLFSHPESSKPLQLVDRAQLSAHISREKPRGASEVKGFLFRSTRAQEAIIAKDKPKHADFDAYELSSGRLVRGD